MNGGRLKPLNQLQRPEQEAMLSELADRVMPR